MVSFDDEAFHAITRQSGGSLRIRPLTEEEVTRVDELIGPRRKDDGSLIVPLQFAAANPFRLETRLRNWLRYAIRDHEIAALRARCENLVARICLAEGNAQRLGSIQLNCGSR